MLCLKTASQYLEWLQRFGPGQLEMKLCTFLWQMSVYIFKKRKLKTKIIPAAGKGF